MESARAYAIGKYAREFGIAGVDKVEVAKFRRYEVLSILHSTDTQTNTNNFSDIQRSHLDAFLNGYGKESVLGIQPTKKKESPAKRCDFARIVQSPSSCRPLFSLTDLDPCVQLAVCRRLSSFFKLPEDQSYISTLDTDITLPDGSQYMAFACNGFTFNFVYNPATQKINSTDRSTGEVLRELGEIEKSQSRHSNASRLFNAQFFSSDLDGANSPGIDRVARRVGAVPIDLEATVGNN